MIALCEYGKDTTFTETQQSLQLSGCGTLLYFPDHLKFRWIKIVSHLSTPSSLFGKCVANPVPNACSPTIDLFIRTLEFLVKGFFYEIFQIQYDFPCTKKRNDS
jgi:hypothetical protein